MLRPRVVQVRNAARLAIEKTMTKGKGERTHLEQSFMIWVLRVSVNGWALGPIDLGVRGRMKPLASPATH